MLFRPKRQLRFAVWQQACTGEPATYQLVYPKLMPEPASSRSRWIGIPARVFAFTFLLTLLSFAVVLLLSILGTVIYSRVEHVAPNLMFAYKHIAFPIALSAGALVLIVTLGIEIRNYRREKILTTIERTALNHKTRYQTAGTDHPITR